ncbi:PspA/IM30 family protein [Vibrio pomeroyi]|uniref:PspA/IM30 family protein n=1 Tax=Vibrio pomeroyi TaxID=198832 RepID=A0ABV4MR03_9VIBR|nr:PspA/IM30 family protein [Vibrio atlanticus]MCZ4311415.1 PspA/IM30 family protein [Vibrio atlanticus]
MNAFKKLFTAIKGTVIGGVEAVNDANGITILEQEQREAKQAIRSADESLVGIVAKRKLAQKKVDSLQESISQYEGNAIAASQKDNTELALECAQKVAELIAEQDTEKSQLEAFQKAEKTHRANIATAKTKVDQIDKQIDLVKATEQVQKAQAATHSSVIGASSKTSTALDSLARIQANQEEQAAKFEAQQELHDDATSSDLDKKLKDAGIAGGGLSAEDQLAKILNKDK